MAAWPASASQDGVNMPRAGQARSSCRSTAGAPQVVGARACGASRHARPRGDREARRAQVQELQAALERALRPGQLRRADGASALEVKTVDGFQVGGLQGSRRVGSRVPGGWVPGF